MNRGVLYAIICMRKATNSLLEEAGMEWANTHGYSINPVAGGAGPVWGSSH